MKEIDFDIYEVAVSRELENGMIECETMRLCITADSVAAARKLAKKLVEDEGGQMTSCDIVDFGTLYDLRGDVR